MISGNLVRLIRHLKGLKQESVAKKLGITQQAYSKLENADKIDDTKEKMILSVLEFSNSDLKILKEILDHISL